MNPPYSDFKVWEDYIANCQTMIEQLQMNPIGTPGTAPLPFAGGWQDLAKSFGMPSGQESPFSALAPALGATREYQQIAQRMMDLGVRFQHQYEAFIKLGGEIGQQAQQSVNAKAGTPQILATDPAAMYDAWIAGAEQAYAQVAHGDAFARSLGELINIVSSFKVERGKLYEAFARALDLPSRSEIDSLHRQVRELTLALRAASPPAQAIAAKPKKRRKPRAP